jgi:hypothetical protein
MTYFRMGNPYYHRRGSVSRPCSGWEGVGPERYARQEFGGRCRARGLAWSRHRRILEEVKVLSLYLALMYPDLLKVIGSSRTGN